MVLETKKQCLSLVNEYLNKLESTIKLNSKSNLLNYNILAESFYVGFLNILFHWDLHSSNQSKSNFAGIDAVDDKSKIIVQITSQITKEKIRSTLSNKILRGYPEYHLYFMMITKDSKKLKNGQYEVPEGLTFNPKNDILDHSYLYSQCVNQTDVDLVLQLSSYCEKQDEVLTTPQFRFTILAQVVKSISQLDLSLTSKPIVTRAFSIQKKIDFNKLTNIQVSHIYNVSVYTSELDKIYEQFAQEGHSPLFIFQKIITLYQEELLQANAKSNSQIFLDLADDLVKYIDKSGNLKSMPQEEKEFYCQVIVADAFMRCKIFENPEEINNDSTN